MSAVTLQAYIVIIVGDTLLVIVSLIQLTEKLGNKGNGIKTTDAVENLKSTMDQRHPALYLCQLITNINIDANQHSALVQIRVHIQYSGHPIANDMLYMSEQTVDRSSKGSSADRSARISDASLTSSCEEKVVNECEENSNGDFSIDPMCTNCPNLAPKG